MLFEVGLLVLCIVISTNHTHLHTSTSHPSKRYWTNVRIKTTYNSLARTNLHYISQFKFINKSSTLQGRYLKY